MTTSVSTPDDRRLGQRALTGTLWTLTERFGSLALQFVVNLVLARLLLPADFGYIAVLAIFMALSRVMIDGGLASALIQKKDATNSDFSLIFFWNLTVSLALYALLYASAPIIETFYGMPPLCRIIRVYGLSLILAAMSQVQMTRLRKSLQFRLMSLINLGSYAGGGTLAIYLAYSGYGVWALVWMEVGYALLAALLYNLLSGWRPTLRFSLAPFRQLFSYGGYLLGANLLQEAAKNIQGLLIGYRFSDTQAGLYSQAHKLDQINSYAIPQALVQVMFPLFSHIQNQQERLVATLSQSIRVIAFGIFPLLTLLIIIAEPLTVLLWGDVWLPCAPYFRILSVGGLFVSLQNVNFYAVAARGHSRILFNWSFYKWGFLLISMLAAMYLSVEAILWAMALSNANIYFVNAALVQRHVGLGITRQLAMLLPVTALTAAASAVTLGVAALLPVDRLSAWHIIAETLTFAVIYVSAARLLHLRAYTDVRQIMHLLKNRKP